MKSTTQLCTPEQALRTWQALPEKARASVVGSAFKQIIGLLDANGYAPLPIVVGTLFPDETPEKARTILSTQIANRAYATASGSVPLRLCISRKSKLIAANAQQVWFEAAQLSLPSDAPLDAREHEQSRYVGSIEAQQTTQSEVKQWLAKPARPTELNKELTKAQHYAALSEDKHDQNLGRANPLHGLEQTSGTGSSRGSTPKEKFVHDILADINRGFEGQGKTVQCLNALLAWACDASPKAPRLLALLGDYGTGKTSHAMQLDRVLNGLVPFPSELHSLETKPKPAFIDLSLLAGVPNLAYLSLTELLTVALNKRRSGAVIDAETLIAQARAGEVVMIYDGLDELLKGNEGHALHNLLDQLLRVLESDPATQNPSKAKVMVSCRTHYFRDLQTQHAFFDTRRRGVAQANDYLCLSLLPWNASSVQEYLSKRLPADEAALLLGIIQTTYNLAELASKPVLLSMMCEQVAQLLLEKDSGQSITASRLYAITVKDCLGRDNGKHIIKPHHKPLLMGALATAMWNERVEQWSADKLDGWLARAVKDLFPNQYGTVDVGALQDDLRTATFIVRTNEHSDSFNFSHKSFAEYFVARWVWDCTNYQHDGLMEEAVIRKYLPTRRLNKEATDFAREMWVSSGGAPFVERNNDRNKQNSTEMHVPTLSPLGERAGERGCSPSTQNQAYRQSAYLFKYLQDENTTLELRDTLFDIILNLNLLKKQTVHLIAEAGQKIIQANKPINLKGLKLIQKHWEDLDFSLLPPVDFRDANLLCLRASRCNFGEMLCSGGNWAQTVFRACAVDGIKWGDADRGGMMVRLGEKKKINKALKGPWSRPCYEKTRTIRFAKDFLVGEAINDKYFDVVTGREVILDPEQTKFSNFGHLKEKHHNGEKIYDDSWRGNGYVSSMKLSPIRILGVINSKNYYSVVIKNQVEYWKNNKSGACVIFDPDGNLLDYDDEAADTWLFCLASGRPEPVETALPLD